MKAVVTGGPCSGKTTLITELEKKGYCVLHEIAREVLKENKKFKTFLEFQREIFDKTLERNKKISKSKPCFLDVDIIEGVAYLKNEGIEVPKWLLEKAKELDYDKVFWLEPNPVYEDDGVRFQNEDEAFEISKKIKEEYENFGFEVTVVPWIAIEKRVEFVEKECGLK